MFSIRVTSSLSKNTRNGTLLIFKAISQFGFLTYPIPPVLQPTFSKCLWATPARVPFPPLTEVSSLAPPKLFRALGKVC